jgi:hypothetical protein
MIALLLGAKTERAVPGALSECLARALGPGRGGGLSGTTALAGAAG